MAVLASFNADGSASASVCATDNIENGANNKAHNAGRMSFFVLV